MRWFNVNSIGFRLFLAISGLCAAFVAYSAWSVTAIDNSSQIVKDTYDRPLQALNYARSANATFYRLRMKLVSGETTAPDELADLFLEDLAVARDRSLSAKSRDQVNAIETRFQEWRTAISGDNLRPAVSERDIANSISLAFDELTETMAADSFMERQRSVNAVETSRRIALAGSAAGVMFSLFIVFILARQIVRPLSLAAGVADRISGGDFTVSIPTERRDETGALLRSMNIMQKSITSMIEREEARRKSAEVRMVDALDKTSAAILLLDREGGVIFANRQVFEFFPELNKHIAEGRTLDDAVQALQRRELNAIAQGDDAPSDEVRLANGRWVHATQSVTREGEAIQVWTDITPLREREERLKIATAQAQAASAAKSRFLANISHELKTPLNAIIGFSEIIHSESFGSLGSPEYKEYSKYVLGGGRRLLELISEVLELAREGGERADIQMGPVRLRDAIDHAVGCLMESATAAGVRLIADAAPDDIWVWGEESRLAHAFRNLISNGIKFSKSDGVVRLSVLDEGAMARIIIADNGVGMNPSDIPLALSAFDQLDGELTRRHEGAGTGLPFAKAVIDQHGGQLTVESALGAGTSVSISLLNAKLIARGSLSIPAAAARTSLAS